ncbi:hypothetical protein ACFWUZ_15925 [Streptomyces sp. NPDC058646]|uniref:hypothetical protein n=1 Tax=Streptomyces sp. NPDC058646 TaxID=3346574 RepID=UPI0036528CE9
MRGPDEPRRAAGAWARLAQERVTAPAGGSVSVALTLTVPDRAEPGDHPGAVVALEDRPGGGAARGIGVRQAVAARLDLRVTGPTAPAPAVREVTVSRRGAGAEVS